MAGRRGGARGLILGLALIAVGAALSQISVAEPLTRSGEQATPSKPSLFFGKARQRAKANPAQEVAASRARAADTSCASPWTYSRGLRRCACARDGYSLQSGDCLLDAATSCGDNEHWSPKRSACVCAEGLKRIGGTCAPDEIVTAVADPVTTLPATPVGLSDEQVQAISRAQRCLTELGYYKGPIDGKRGKDTWTAYWNFKHDNGLSGQKDLLSERVQQKMTELCKGLDRPTAIAAEPPPQAELAPVPVAPVAEEATPTPPARLDIDCLPDDLLATLRRAHGQAVTAERCQDTCLPTPSGLPQSHLDDLQRRASIVWCRSCVPVEGHLSLDDVRRIEKAGNLTLCAIPPLQLPRHSGVGPSINVKSYTRTRELYRALPAAEEDQTAIAVIIGNRTYAKLAPSETSRNDAGAMYSFLTEHLGYRQDDIIDLRDAKKADFERLFGTAAESDGELARLVRANPGAKVLVYYSGHGATDLAQTDTYLLPVDTEPYRDEQGGYKLSTLYANLAKLGAKSVLLLLETEYGRDHSPYLLPPNLPETVNSALPPSPLPGLTVLLAADRGQRRLTDSTYNIGLFTRYLIEGMAGSADLPPIGNGDGKLDSAEIYVYTGAMVRLAARKTFGLLQNPVYSSGPASVLSSAGPQAAGAN